VTTISYREDLGDLHHLLSGDLTHILTDIRYAIAALTWLTQLDGPQPIEISTGITAAERAIRTAQQALEQAAEPTGRNLP